MDNADANSPPAPELPVIDRARTCPLCHHDRSLPQPAMNGYPMRACPRCCGRWAVCVAADLPDYDSDYQTGEREVYHRYREELQRIRAGGEPPIYWFQKRQLERVRPFGQRRLLEIGCGNGMFLLAARRAGWQAQGLEVSTHVAEQAREISDCPVHVGGLGDLASKGATFDVVSGFEIFEHVLDARSALAAATDVLAPGGVLALSVPNDRSPYTRTPPDAEGRPPYHINFFRPRTLEVVLRDLALEVSWLYEKPFAWSETRRPMAVRTLMLPWLVFAGLVLGRKGSRLVAWAHKPPSS